MVNARPCETARLVFFFASPRYFDFLDCETENSKCFETPRHLRLKNETARRTYNHSKKETARPVKFD